MEESLAWERVEQVLVEVLLEVFLIYQKVVNLEVLGVVGEELITILKVIVIQENQDAARIARLAAAAARITRVAAAAANPAAIKS